MKDAEVMVPVFLYMSIPPQETTPDAPGMTGGHPHSVQGVSNETREDLIVEEYKNSYFLQDFCEATSFLGPLHLHVITRVRSYLTDLFLFILASQAKDSAQAMLRLW